MVSCHHQVTSLPVAPCIFVSLWCIFCLETLVFSFRGVLSLIFPCSCDLICFDLLHSLPWISTCANLRLWFSSSPVSPFLTLSPPSLPKLTLLLVMVLSSHKMHFAQLHPWGFCLYQVHKFTQEPTCLSESIFIFYLWQKNYLKFPVFLSGHCKHDLRWSGPVLAHEPESNLLRPVRAALCRTCWELSGLQAERVPQHSLCFETKQRLRFCGGGGHFSFPSCYNGCLQYYCCKWI